MPAGSTDSRKTLPSLPRCFWAISSKTLKSKTRSNQASLPDDVERRCWTGLLSYDDINPALARLEEANWLRGFPVGVTPRGGRPTIGFEIHPSILAGRNESQK